MKQITVFLYPGFITKGLKGRLFWHPTMPEFDNKDNDWQIAKSIEITNCIHDPWPFIAGAVVGGIIVHSAEASQPRVVSPRQPEPPVLVNGVWMQRTYQCVQEIVVDRYGNENLANRCNWVFVPVQVEK